MPRRVGVETVERLTPEEVAARRELDLQLAEAEVAEANERRVLVVAFLADDATEADIVAMRVWLDARRATRRGAGRFWHRFERWTAKHGEPRTATAQSARIDYAIKPTKPERLRFAAEAAERQREPAERLRANAERIVERRKAERGGRSKRPPTPRTAPGVTDSGPLDEPVDLPKPRRRQKAGIVGQLLIDPFTDHD